MAGSVNKVILVGNLGKDPETRRLNSGEPVVNLRIATSESWKDKATGERKEKTEWHNVVIFNENLARVAEQYLRKGSKVYVEGQLQTRKWTDQSGQEKYTTEVVLQRFRGELTILDGRGGGGETSEDDRGSKSGEFGRSSPMEKRPAMAGTAGGSRFSSDLDEDNPFSRRIDWDSLDPALYLWKVHDFLRRSGPRFAGSYSGTEPERGLCRTRGCASGAARA